MRRALLALRMQVMATDVLKTDPFVFDDLGLCVQIVVIFTRECACMRCKLWGLRDGKMTMGSFHMCGDRRRSWLSRTSHGLVV